MSGKHAGFTIVEVLVAVFILGIVLTGLLSLVTGTLNFSTVAVSSSDRIRELNDVTGYLGDKIRGASEVVVSGSEINIASAPNGGICEIDDSTTPCFSVVVPEATSGTGIDKYTQFFYRIEPRSALPDEYKVANSWADDNTYIIKEYRNVLCTGSECDDASNREAEMSVSGAQWYLVLDGLQMDFSTQPPFEYVDSSGEFSLNFRVADHRRGTTRYTPADEPYELTVIKRN